MTYVLMDKKGYLFDIASVNGLEELTEFDGLQELLSKGESKDLESVAAGLRDAGLTEEADKVEAATAPIILSDGIVDDDEDEEQEEEEEEEEEFADFNAQWIEIFRAGDYGDKGTWTESDLDRVVANFAAGIWKAPAVIGHPEADSPAMGWVAGLKRDGPILHARFDRVQPELEAVTQNGRYPNRSAAFYTDPKATGPVLRHVGFLGAMPPEVKGLAPVKFSQETFTSIDFEEESIMDEATIKKTVAESVKAFFADMFGPKKNAETFSEEQVKAQIAAANAPLLAQLTQIGTQFTELGKKLDAATTDNRKSRATAFVDKMKAAGKWVPAFSEMGMEALLEQAATSGTSVKFGEAGKEKESGSFETLCAFLESHGKIVPSGSLTGKLKIAGKVVRFNEAEGISLDEGSVAWDALTKKMLAANPKMEYAEALQKAAEQLDSGTVSA